MLSLNTKNLVFHWFGTKANANKNEELQWWVAITGQKKIVTHEFGLTSARSNRRILHRNVQISDAYGDEEYQVALMYT